MRKLPLLLCLLGPTAWAQQALPPVGPPNGIACAHNNSAPVLADGTVGWVQCDPTGNLITAPLDGATGTGSATSAAVFSNMPVSTVGYNSAYIQITSVGVGTVAFEQSLDAGTTWGAIMATSVSSNASPPTSSSAALVAGTVYSLPATGQFRLRVSAYTSGTFSAAWVLKNSQRDGTVVSLTGSGAVQPTAIRPQPSFGGTLARIQSAASTNATSIKASAGQIYHCPLYNNGAAAAYLKLYNKASAPAVGTDTPAVVIGIGPSGFREVNFADIGTVFSTGIAYAITAGAADTDTTAVAANQIVGACSYN